MNEDFLKFMPKEGQERDEFKEGDVVVWCGERLELEDGDFVEPGDVGAVLGPASMEEYEVLVDFPHCELFNCYHSFLRLHSEGERKAIADGIPPKRLWSAIDHTGDSPGQPEGKARWHGQAVDGFGARSQDYGTKFVNGNKGVG